MNNLIKQLIQSLIHTGNVFKKAGLQEGSKSLGETLRKIVYSKHEFYLLAHDLESAKPVKNTLRYQLKAVTCLDDIECLAYLHGLSTLVPFPVQYLKNVFIEGGVGVIAFYKNAPVGCGWLSDTINPQLMRVPVPMESGDIYIHSLFVERKERKHGCARLLIRAVLHTARENGYKRGLSIVLKNKISRWKFFLLFKGKIIGEVIHTRVLLKNFFKHKMWSDNRLNL
nr:GNAT family N-acetyltransferase [uncultured Desulfuromonas sp.]